MEAVFFISYWKLSKQEMTASSQGEEDAMTESLSKKETASALFPSSFPSK